jgi:hypothetical protein
MQIMTDGWWVGRWVGGGKKGIISRQNSNNNNNSNNQPVSLEYEFRPLKFG